MDRDRLVTGYEGKHRRHAGTSGSDGSGPYVGKHRAASDDDDSE
jgi:hypothetical protein